MHGGMIGRKLENGPSGSGFKDANEPSFTLTSSSHAVHGVVVAQKQSHSQYKMDQKTSTLTSHEAKQFSDLVIADNPIPIQDGREINKSQNGSGIGNQNSPAFTLDTIGAQAVATNIVRRLTPIECERLQGFPDGWTAGQPDSARYKQLGNAVTVPVVEWIINRMVKLSMATEANKNESLWLD
jgi:DNA (cytosine-5)-methyltransferase 1